MAQERRRTHLDGNVVAALGGDDPVPVVVVDDVVVDREEVRVVVGVEAVSVTKNTHNTAQHGPKLENESKFTMEQWAEE